MLEKLRQFVESERSKELVILEAMGVDPDSFENEIDSDRASAFRVTAYNAVLSKIDELLSREADSKNSED